MDTVMVHTLNLVKEEVTEITVGEKKEVSWNLEK